MYGLYVDRAAGEYRILYTYATTPHQINQFSCVAESYSEDEILELVRKMREESKVFAVFFNHATGEGFVSVEDCFSGNWRGSKYAPYSLIGEYATEEEAAQALAQLQG